jgi:hypothetical protein
MGRTIFPCICLIAIIFWIHAYFGSIARADGVDFNTDHQYINSRGTTKFKLTGENLDTNYEQINQLYNLNLSKNIYPYLLFNSGTVYQINSTSSSSGDNNVDTEEKILTPFAELNLTNPIYQAGLAYHKRRIEEDVTDLPDTRADRDEITGTLGMNPPSDLFPDWSLRYSDIHTYDDPETQDQFQKVWMLDTAYAPLSGLLLDYSYARTDTEEKFLNFDTVEQSHLGTAEYSRNFLNGRLSMDTSYTVNYNKFEFSRGGGTSEVPLLRFAGLSSLSNTPEDGPAMGANPALIDGNLTASAGLNIGTAGDQSQPVNLGLDFGFAIDVDTLYVWIDRRPTSTVVNSFSWSVYTSPDNTDFSTWTLVATVSPANFGTLDNRFEISFPRVNTRFIKVVTPALSPVVPGAGSFPNIFVTELQAFITTSGASFNSESSVLNQNYNLGLRGQLTASTLLGYNLFYTKQDTDPGNIKRTQYTNGIYLNHTFNDTFSANANGQRTDISNDVADGSEDSYNYTYGTSLRANWLATFNQALTFSGSYDNTELGSSSQNALFLRNNAILYQGWSAFLDTGYTWEQPQIGSRITSIIVRQGTNLQPNQKISLNLSFSYKRTMESGEDVGPSDETRWDIQGFYIPFRNLSFFAKINSVNRDNSTDTFQNYTVNWSPFPDGDLQFFFVFNEILLSESNQEDRVVGPGLKWTIGPHISLDMSYNYTTSDNDTEKIESNVFSADLRTHF